MSGKPGGVGWRDHGKSNVTRVFDKPTCLHLMFRCVNVYAPGITLLLCVKDPHIA